MAMVKTPVTMIINFDIDRDVMKVNQDFVRNV
jgi:hypothetical protein